MPTINEVSELAGVSLATVSRVINGSDRVRESTKAKVRAAMAELGYTPNTAAQSLAGSRSNTLGMVVSWLDGPFYGPVMSGIEEELRKYNKHVIIASGHGDPEQEKDAVNYLKARQVDGLILLTECLDRDYLIELSKELPIYLINQHFEGFEARNMWLDNELGGYEATRFLIQNGHTNIVCASGQQHKQDARERVEGFKRAMSEAGLLCDEKRFIHTVFDMPGGLAAMKHFEQSGVDFTAVFAGSDEMAFGVMEWARQKNISVPEELSIVGFDNQLVADYVHPRLTTMNFPAYEMAKASAYMAVRELYFKEAPNGQQFKPSLVVRCSVAEMK